jgi:tRNA threonylcarbamoyladenosine biosynthesis protein TsaE
MLGMKRIMRHLSDQAATQQFGEQLGRSALKLLSADPQLSLVAHLSGELGAGKTTLSQALIKAMGVSGRIKSPTFTLVETYACSSSVCSSLIRIHHFDCYRFASASEWAESGFDEIVSAPGLNLIEWPALAQPALGLPSLSVQIFWADVQDSDRGRNSELNAHDEAGSSWLSTLAELTHA